ncbi:hypothetical protein [Terriglobus aquaticus]|uniref:Uncharacterized protein n=1 Tax=Terriglobus aquaticus TaxID=940139 RepID=A0ABW9KLS7_9BACT|nr:hypothetical protein [Terriglobus aquaticus]
MRDEFEFISLKADADYNKPGARMTMGWMFAAAFLALPARLVFDSFGKGACGNVAYFSFYFGLLIARDHWFLHRTMRFWLVAFIFSVSHLALIAAFWHSHLALNRWSFYPVAALDLTLCAKWIRGPRASEDVGEVSETCE